MIPIRTQTTATTNHMLLTDGDRGSIGIIGGAGAISRAARLLSS